MSRACCSGSLEIASSGTVIDLLGGDSAVVSEVLSDLVMNSQSVSVDRMSLARTYGKDGVGARDPRTGATVLRIKDVLRGNLHPFLEAWRAQAAAVASASV